MAWGREKSGNDTHLMPNPTLLAGVLGAAVCGGGLVQEVESLMWVLVLGEAIHSSLLERHPVHTSATRLSYSGHSLPTSWGRLLRVEHGNYWPFLPVDGNYQHKVVRP